MIDTLKANLLSPIPLAFALGIAARLMRSEFSLPKDIYSALSIYLLFALGLKGGVELAHAPFSATSSGSPRVAIPARTAPSTRSCTKSSPGALWCSWWVVSSWGTSWASRDGTRSHRSLTAGLRGRSCSSCWRWALSPAIASVISKRWGRWAGLSPGGAAVRGTMAASASYIAAPPAVRLTLPDANPTYSLTAALAITFPFNILAGIPIYYRIALAIAS